MKRPVPPDDDPAMIALGRGVPGNAGTCAIGEYDRAHVDLQCDARQDGLVVLSELYADGWSATLDGHEARFLPADIVLRGVAVKTEAAPHHDALRNAGTR